MRIGLVVSFILLVGCHKPGPRRLGNSLVAMKDRIARAVKLDVSVKAKVDAKALATPPPAQRVREEPRPAQQQQQQTPAPDATPPPMRIDRVDASRPTQFVLRGQTHDGSSFCEAHPTLQECNQSCTGMLRANALQKPEPSSAKHCACTEQDRGC